MQDDYLVYTPVIRLRNGRVLYASAYGLKAFCLRIKRKK